MMITFCSSLKQAATTQRWKLAITAKGSDLPLHTKIEFSRRGMREPVVFEPVDGLLMRDYQLTPILASHYPADVAFRQKVDALIHRSQTQARDIFDLAHLLRCGVSTQGMILPTQWREAQHNALSVSFDDFKSQVLSFLSPEYQEQYAVPEVWDEMVIRVVDAVKGEPS